MLRGVEVWTDLACAGGVRVTAFLPDDLLAASVTDSLVGQEGCTLQVPTTLPAVAALVARRVLRVTFTAADGSEDAAAAREYRIAHLSDAHATGVLTVRGDPILLDLARAVYWSHDADGRPSVAVTATQMTPAEYIDTFVLPACDTAGLTWVERGTVEHTGGFDFAGEWLSALELLQWLADRSQTGHELRLRRNGDTDYRIDLVAVVGAAAAVVPVQAGRNLVALQRTRDTLEMATVVVPQGRDGAVHRTMGHALWRVSAIPGGAPWRYTLADPNTPAGSGPVAVDDQLNGLWAGRIASTYTTVQVTDSFAATQQVEFAASTGWAVGDLVEFRATSGASGQRMLAVSHPTSAAVPGAGGYGSLTRILPLDVDGAANIAANPWMRDWAAPYTSAPTGWTWEILNPTSQGGTAGSWGSSTSVPGKKTPRVAYHTVGTGTRQKRISTTATPPTSPATRRWTAYARLYHDAIDGGGVVYTLAVRNPARSTTYASTTVGPLTSAAQRQVWLDVSLTDLDLSAATGGVVVDLETSVSARNFAVEELGLTEAAARPAQDVEVAGGTRLWQAANTLLAARATPVTGYTVQLADLARLDRATWGADGLTLGGSIAIRDPDLGVSVTQRLVEQQIDLLDPLNTTVTIGTRDATLTDLLAAAGR